MNPKTLNQGAGDPETTLLTESEFADMIRLKSQSVRKRRLSGSGPRFIKLAGGRGPVRYRLADILEWLNEQTRNSTSEEE